MRGIVPMLHDLYGGRERSGIYRKAGFVISSMSLDPDGNNGDGEITVKFADGETYSVRDEGRSCCESRYITTDDDLDMAAGSTLSGIEINGGPEAVDDYGEPHETAFLRFITDRGTFVFTTHNKHNGYYGGFCFLASKAEPKE